MGERVTFTTGQIARYIGVSVPAVQGWIKAGKLKAFKTPGGGRYVVLLEDLRAFLETSKVPFREEELLEIARPEPS